MFGLISVVVYFSFIPRAHAHVSWLQPEARWPPFDYVNTRNHLQPCGVAAVNRTFCLQGGLQINLFDSNKRFVERIAPVANSTADFFDVEGVQVQELRVKFERPCANCTLQIVKEAREYADRARFISCADVNIVPADRLSLAARECRGNGEWDDDQCVCDAEHEGTNCEVRVECKTKADCRAGGLCRAQWNDRNSRVCYCANGRFGRNCERESNFNEINECFNILEPLYPHHFAKYGVFNASCYEKKPLNEEDVVYSRVVGDEVEIVLDYATASWVAVGWRPLDIAANCRDFPLEHLPNAGYTPKARDSPLHPMHCIDLIWGAVVNGTKLRIRDSYARDKSTPLEDDEYPDGRQSLTAAFGRELEGRTIVMFRRAIKTDDPADHPLGPARLFGVFSKGQPHNERSGIVRAALEAPENAERVFIRQDEFTYHGQGEQRGLVVFHFVH
ncbi:DOMON domain-containing protein [Aphelenchoides fujianensis]|nr:DOMON domain-containing protein [Aphelenchoides fujianensis]